MTPTPFGLRPFPPDRGNRPHPPAVSCPAKQHGKGQADPVDAAGPNLRRARAQWPGKRGTATQILPAGRDQPPKGPQKTAFWFLCRRGQRNPPPGRRNSPFCVLSNDGKNQRSPGAGSEECQHSSRPPPDPRYEERFPEVVPRTRRGWFSGVSPLPRRCRWLGN